jgi:hypothetical protein
MADPSICTARDFDHARFQPESRTLPLSRPALSPRPVVSLLPMADHEHHEQQEGVFKVTDRRKFTSDGDLRDTAEAEKQPAAAPPPPPPPPQAAAPAPPAPTEPADDGDPGFERVVLSFAQTAMMQLGLVAMDGGQPYEPDLMGARETIDMLAVLESKTRGNLNAREKRLIHETLHELQLAFVGVQRNMVGPRSVKQ